VPAGISEKKTEPGKCNESWKSDEVVPAPAVFCQQPLYDSLIDAFSTRGFVPRAGATAHAHFFDAFGKFFAAEANHRGEWVDEAATRAAAVETHGYSYADLKKMARIGLEHAFLPGKSVWANQDAFAQPVSECSKDALGMAKPSKSCAEFLKLNEQARQQWELEKGFRKFEAEL